MSKLRADVPPARVDRAFRRPGEAALYSVAIAPLLAEAWDRRAALTIADALSVVPTAHVGATSVTADERLSRPPALGAPSIAP